MYYAPDLWTEVPGGKPQLAYEDPRRDSDLLPAAVVGDGYVFAEENERLYGLNGWRIWLLAHPGAMPTLLDSSNPATEATSPLPSFAVSADWLVWNAYHGTPQAAVSELLALDLHTMHRSVLLKRLVSMGNYSFPAISGDTLVYGASTERPDGTYDDHVERLDLGHAGAAPVQLDTDGEASTPVISGQTVVWKEGGSAFDQGLLEAETLGHGPAVELEVGTQPSFLYPSIGNRYVTGWGTDDRQLWLYDLQAGRAVPLIIQPQGGNVVEERPELAGNLVVWSQGVLTVDAQGFPTTPLQAMWMQLPP